MKKMKAMGFSKQSFATALGLCVMLTTHSALAVDRTWTGGGTDTGWTNVANWGGTDLAAGDRPVFAGSIGTSNTNDFPANTSFAGIQFDAGAGAFTLAGNPITLGGNIDFSANPSSARTHTINLGLFLGADCIISNQPNGHIAIGGIVAGGYKLTKQGSGTLTLSGDNTYSGTTTVSAGKLVLQHTNALGSISANTTVAAGATLQLMGDISFAAEPLALPNDNGNTVLLQSVSGTNTWNGTITATGSEKYIRLSSDDGLLTLANTITDNRSTASVVLQGAGAITVSGKITGASGLISGSADAGAGSIRTLSNIANDYTGKTGISGGTLSINSINNVNGEASALGAPTTEASGTITIGSGAFSGTLRYTGGASATDRVIDLAGTTGGATLDHSGSGLLTFTRGFATSGAGSKTLTLQGSTTGSGEIAGAITNNATGSVTLTKKGTGTWALSGDNTYTGVTAINGGTLLVNGSHVAAGAYTVLTNATLGGSGAIGSDVIINNGGTLAPGGTNAAARLTCNANVTLAANARFHVSINGPAVSTQYDQLAMSGNTLALGGANLEVKVAPDYAPKSGTAFVIASGFTALPGTFAGLPEGAELQPDGARVSFYIHYDTTSSPQKVWLRARNLYDRTVILVY